MKPTKTKQKPKSNNEMKTLACIACFSDKKFLLPKALEAAIKLNGKQKILLLYFGEKEELQNFRHLKGIEIELMEPKKTRKEEFIEAFNKAKEKMIQEKFDFLFFFDQRIIPSIECIESLLEKKKEIIAPAFFIPRIINSGERNARIYFANYFEFSGDEKNKKITQKTFFDAVPSQLIEADMILLNAAIISKNAIEKINLNENSQLPELDFALQAKKAGMKLFVDSGNVCGYRENILAKIE